MFTSRCQWYLKDNPGQVINITTEVNNERMLINPRMKKSKRADLIGSFFILILLDNIYLLILKLYQE